MTWIAVALSLWMGAPQVAQLEPKATARITGRVTAADTGKPIQRALLRLVSFEVMRVAKTAVTDAEGRFEFTGLVAGRYQLDASAERYVGLQYGQVKPPEPGRPIDLIEDQSFREANFALPRMGAIEGVLTDEFGDPAPNVVVQISRLDFVAGRRRLMPIGGPATSRKTDDKGQFRIFNLAPGDYYVTALSGAFAEQNETGGFAPTYYPGTAAVGAARPVRLAFGQERTNITFGLVPAPMARVSGRLIDASDQPLGQASLLIAPSDQAGTTGFMIVRAVAGPDGRFTFRNVPPGRYTIQAFGPLPTGALGRAPFGWLTIAVDGEPIQDLVVKVTPGASLRGRITLEGDLLSAPKPTQVRVSAGPVDFDSAPVVGGGPPNMVTREDWTFETNNMNGLRVVRVDVLNAPQWTLKRVVVDGKDVTDAPLDFRSGDVNDVKIVLSNRAATVSGRVLDADGKPSSNYSVVIFAADSNRWPFPSRFVALGRPNQGGSFRVSGLPPETYLVVPLPALDGTEWQDPEFLDKLRGLATSVTLGEGETRTLELKIAR